MPVLRPGRPSGAGLAGFRRTGQAGQGPVDVPEPAADPGRGQPPGRACPRQAQVRRQRAGEPELGMAGDDDPGPPVSGGRVTESRGGPAKDLLEQPEGVLKIKSAQERLPQPVHLSPGGPRNAQVPALAG